MRTLQKRKEFSTVFDYEEESDLYRYGNKTEVNASFKINNKHKCVFKKNGAIAKYENYMSCKRLTSARFDDYKLYSFLEKTCTLAKRLHTTYKGTMCPKII